MTSKKIPNRDMDLVLRFRIPEINLFTISSFGNSRLAVRESIDQEFLDQGAK